MSDFILSRVQLAELIKGNPYVDYWHSAMERCLPDYDINSPQRLVKVWPKYFPNMDIANQYAGNEEKIANRAYANRMGNGPEASGDGWRFCGRGLIQLTGRNNYQQFADSIETDINDIPAYLATFEGAVQSACWFWETNNLNKFADAGDMLTLTKRINGGTLGLDDRIKHYQHALHVLGL
ncbi:glycoside hydrolase family 19 protein [bacterium]|nr:glycoside hydrolase family 19 protein [bacterium]